MRAINLDPWPLNKRSKTKKWQIKAKCKMAPFWRENQSAFGLAYQGKDIVFRFIIEYSSLRDFGP